MVGLALLLAVAGPAARPAPAIAQATASVRILKAATISASALSLDIKAWHEHTIRLPDGSVEQVRIVDFP